MWHSIFPSTHFIGHFHPKIHNESTGMSFWKISSVRSFIQCEQPWSCQYNPIVKPSFPCSTPKFNHKVTGDTWISRAPIAIGFLAPLLHHYYKIQPIWKTISKLDGHQPASFSNSLNLKNLIHKFTTFLFTYLPLLSELPIAQFLIIQKFY